MIDPAAIIDDAVPYFERLARHPSRLHGTTVLIEPQAGTHLVAVLDHGSDLCVDRNRGPHRAGRDMVILMRRQVGDEVGKRDAATLEMGARLRAKYGVLPQRRLQALGD